MSSPATDTFMSYWRNNASRAPVVLAKIELTVPSTVTLYLATRDITTPDGQTWDNGLRSDAIRDRIENLSPGPSPASTAIYLANRTYTALPSDRIDAQIAAYQWQGATVTLWLWNDVRHPTTHAQQLAWADAFAVFTEGRCDSYDVGDSWIKLNMLQDQSWNNPVPDLVVDKLSYPNAPDVSQGRPVPIIYGDHKALPMRSPWTAAYTNKQYQEDAGAGEGVVPGLLVDPGLGAAKVKVVYASHACKDILDRTAGLTQFLAVNDVLAPIDTTGITEALNSDESYITIDDDTLLAYYGVRPLEPRTTYNTAADSRRAADPFDETSYATINGNVAELTLPSPSPLGYIEEVKVYVAFVGDAANTSTLRVRPQIPGGANGTAVTATLVQSQSTTPFILSGTWDGAFWNQNWQFGGAAATTPWDIRVDFTVAGTNKAHVLWAVLRVKFRPQRSLVTPAYLTNRLPTPLALVTQVSPGAQTLAGGGLAGALLRSTGGTFGPAQFESQGQFFANLKGYSDTVGGTYTGSASALIERPCDIARHFLETYGVVASGGIETGATSYGSFVLARDLLRNAEPTDYKMACWIGSKTSVQRVLQQIAMQSLGCILLDRFSGKWHFNVWRRQPAVDYSLEFARVHVADLFEAGVLSDVGLAQGIRVRWAYDYFKNRTLFETFVNADGSSQGYEMPTVHDQVLTVVAGVNDDLDWQKGASVYADVLTAGTYEPIDLAVEIQTRMRTHSTEMHVGHSFTVKTGYNDKLDFTVGASTYAATLAPGRWSADGLAREVARAMSAISGSTFTCTYTHSSNSYTIAISTGTFAIKVHTGANILTSAWPVLCINQDAVAAASQSGGRCYNDRFWASCERFGGATTFKFLWLSGASTGTNCAYLVGETRAADTDNTVPPGAQGYWNAEFARSDREGQCSDSEDAFGPRADADVVADWVRDESSAQRLRDGIFDFGNTPRAWVRFRSHSCPDLRRMQTFAFSSDMDARKPYPVYASGGSWDGKVFRALEVEQDMGPSFHTEVYAEEA